MATPKVVRYHMSNDANLSTTVRTPIALARGASAARALSEEQAGALARGLRRRPSPTGTLRLSSWALHGNTRAKRSPISSRDEWSINARYADEEEPVSKRGVEQAGRDRGRAVTIYSDPTDAEIPRAFDDEGLPLTQMGSRTAFEESSYSSSGRRRKARSRMVGCGGVVEAGFLRWLPAGSEVGGRSRRTSHGE